MDKVVWQNYHARIAGLFLDAMCARSMLDVGDNVRLPDPEAVSAAIKALSPHDFNDLVADVQTRAFKSTAWQGKGQDDLEVTTLYRLPSGE
jgi:hypothetical protein